jgi:hypothetical protein
LPIFVVDLFPSDAPVPKNLAEVQDRMIEISYENRFWSQEAGTFGDVTRFARMLENLRQQLPDVSAIKSDHGFQRLERLRALKNLHVVPAPRFPTNSFRDFSAQGVEARYNAGYEAMKTSLASLPA